MIAGRWFITPHAVRRFIERYCPTLTYEQALGHLVEAALVAHRDGLYKGGPAEIWRVGPLSMVVGPPRGEWVAPQLITVLRPKKGFRNVSGNSVFPVSSSPPEPDSLFFPAG